MSRVSKCCMMIAAVLLPAFANFQILWGVIGAIAVFMVDFLIGPESPAQDFLHNKAMLKDGGSATRDSNVDIAIGPDMFPTFKAIMPLLTGPYSKALTRAIFGGSSFVMGILGDKDVLAILANKGWHPLFLA